MRRKLPTYLRGFALEIYRSLTESEKKDYALLKKKLIDKLKHNEDEIAAKLYGRIQGKDESVSDFSKDVISYTREAFGDCSDEVQSRIMLQVFTNGLNSDLQDYVWSKECKTFEEASQQARKREARNSGNAKRDKIASEVFLKIKL